VEFKAVRLKIMKKDKDTRKESFLELNHRGKCPVLVDRTFKYQQHEIILNESLAIIQYYDKVFLNEKYSGFTTEYYTIIIIRVQETNNILEVYEPLEELFNNISVSNPVKEKIFKAYSKLQKELIYWEKYASQNTYIASPFLSLADIAFFPILDYIDYRGFVLIEKDFPNLYRYYHHIRTTHEITRNKAFPNEWHNKLGRQRNLYHQYLTLHEKEIARKIQHNVHAHRQKEKKQRAPSDYSAVDCVEYFEGNNILNLNSTLF